MTPLAGTSITGAIGALSGALGSALVFTGLIITNGTTEAVSVRDTPAAIAATYDLNRGEIRRGVALALVGLFLLIWFVGYLQRRVRASAPRGAWLGAVIACGGAVGMAGVALYLALLVAATNTAIASTPETARTLLILSWEFAGVLAPAWGALVGATSLALIRGGLATWPTRIVAGLGLPLAVGLALSGFLGGFLVALALLWLFALALTLLAAAVVGRTAPEASPVLVTTSA